MRKSKAFSPKLPLIAPHHTDRADCGQPSVPPTLVALGRARARAGRRGAGTAPPRREGPGLGGRGSNAFCNTHYTAQLEHMSATDTVP